MTTEIRPSVYQQAIYDAVTSSSSNLVIEAVAGSGKTTTIVRAVELLPETTTALFLAFNKSIATELKGRMPANAEASTFHSLAFRALVKRVKFQTDDRKVWGLLRTACDLGFCTPKEYDDYGVGVVSLVAKAKHTGVGVLIDDTLDAWSAMIAHYGISFDSDDEPFAIWLARIVLAANNHPVNHSVLDFDDYLYYLVLFKVALPTYDVVFVDEAQDTNAIQREILRRLVGKAGRLIAVGDTHQAIYGFRGASHDAMALITAEFHAQTLPLSVSYRCSRAVVESVQQYVPTIVAAPNAIVGNVDDWFDMHLNDFSATNADDVVLCRNTAPLITLAYALLRNHVGVRVLGRDIGQGLVNLINKMKAQDLDTLITKLEAYRAKEVTKLLAKEREDAAQAVEDKVESIYAANDSYALTLNVHGTIDGLIAHIMQLFNQQHGVLTLSTVHKAKGMEWRTVYLLDKQLMPSKYARKEWQFRQEQNIIYVAHTRAKESLYYIDSEQLLSD